MITRTQTIEIKPDSREIESEIWDMDSVEQSDLILALSQRYKNEYVPFLRQLSYVRDELDSDLNDEEMAKVIDMFETILEYLKED